MNTHTPNMAHLPESIMEPKRHNASLNSLKKYLGYMHAKDRSNFVDMLHKKMCTINKCFLYNESSCTLNENNYVFSQFQHILLFTLCTNSFVVFCGILCALYECSYSFWRLLCTVH